MQLSYLSHRLLRACFIAFLQITFGASAKVNTDGGYDIAIALSPNIPQDVVGLELINKIKETVESASAKLYEASRHRFHFKTATISFPNTWIFEPLPQDYSKGPAVYDEADVRVIKTNVGSPEQPPLIATERDNTCGRPGEYIQISSNYFENRLITKEEREQKFLQNWAALRYGVFEETGFEDSDIFPAIYHAEDGWKKTGCENPHFWLFDPTSQCSAKPDSCQFKKGESTFLNSSIMNSNGAPPSKFFCSSDAGTQHNINAPTPQNAFCNHKSTWEVIGKSEDYKTATSPPSSRPSVEFRIVQRTKIATAIVVDSKLCGYNNEKTHTIAPSIAKVIKETGQIYVMIDDVAVAAVGGQNVYDQFVSNCRRVGMDRSSRSAKNALKMAADKIKTGGPNAWGTIIYVSDDGTTSDEEILSFLSENQNMHLHVINYPPRNDKLPDDYMDYNFFPHSVLMDENSVSCDLHARVQLDKVFGSILSRYRDSSALPKMLVSTPIVASEPYSGLMPIPFTGNIFIRVYICKDMTYNYRLSLTSMGMDVKMDLSDDPSGLVFNSIESINNQPEINPNKEVISFDPGTGNKPYALTFWLQETYKHIEFKGTILQESSSTSQNNVVPPVLKVVTDLDNLKIVAKIRDMANYGQLPITVPLRKLPKEESSTLFKHTYSYHFVEFSSQPTTYSVDFVGTDENGVQLIQSSSTFSSKLAQNNVARFPPGKILDFRTLMNETKDQSVTFKWTAPGKNFGKGIASVYYIHCGPDVEISAGIDNYTPLPDYAKPNSSGTQESYTMSVSPNYDAHYCNLKVEGASGVFSEPSNTAAFYLHTDEVEKSSVGTAVGIAVGVIFFIVIVIIAALFVVRYRRKRTQNEDKVISYIGDTGGASNPTATELLADEKKTEQHKQDLHDDLSPYAIPIDARQMNRTTSYEDEESAPYAKPHQDPTPDEGVNVSKTQDSYQKEPEKPVVEDCYGETVPKAEEGDDDHESRKSGDSSPKQKKSVKGSTESVV